MEVRTALLVTSVVIKVVSVLKRVEVATPVVMVEVVVAADATVITADVV